MIIEDGTGSGRKAAVSSDHFLQTLAQTFPYEHYINHVAKQAFSLLVEQTPTGADDCFFYIKNLDDVDMIINAVTIQSESPESVEFVVSTIGTPVDGTDYIPVNMTSGLSGSADCTCQVGNNITGLTRGSTIDKLYSTNGSSQKYIWLADIIMPKNTTFTLYATTGGIRISLRLSMYYHSVYTHN